MNDEPRSPARSEPVEQEAPPPPAAGGGSASAALASGWGRGALWGVGAFLALVALGELLAVLQVNAAPFGPEALAPLAPGFDVPAGYVVKSGLLTAYQFLHVGIEIDFPFSAFQPDQPFGSASFSASFAIAMMLATALAAWLLFLGGRSVARAGGGPTWALPLHGVKVAFPFVLVALIVSFFARPSLDLSQLGIPGVPEGTEFSTHPSPVSVLFWPLLIALIAAVSGAVSTARGEIFRGEWGRRASGILAGGWRMAWITVALSFVGLLVLAAVHPEQTAGYFEIVGDLGGAGGTFFVLATVLFLPNMATWVAAGALGGSTITVGLLGSSCPLVSLWAFPAGTQDRSDLPPEAFFTDPCGLIEAGARFDNAPLGYFLFLLVPVVAVLLGGWFAARSGRAASRQDGVLIGAGAGVWFALVFVVFLLLSRITAGISGFFGVFAGGSFSIGPGVLSGFGLALAWGVVGGALGGLLAARRPSDAGTMATTAEAES